MSNENDLLGLAAYAARIEVPIGDVENWLRVTLTKMGPKASVLWDQAVEGGARVRFLATDTGSLGCYATITIELPSRAAQRLIAELDRRGSGWSETECTCSGCRPRGSYVRTWREMASINPELPDNHAKV